MCIAKCRGGHAAWGLRWCHSCTPTWLCMKASITRQASPGSGGGAIVHCRCPLGPGLFASDLAAVVKLGLKYFLVDKASQLFHRDRTNDKDGW